ncbi:DNA polymerase III subunit delta [Rubrivivax sp. A210]|uniref:DNA polymerase III subunit delta' n=1 Tax=Rubrivivax sp. A210 TaxID=2772301 RepID=UPI00191802CC|nr:DNA polymerase III subunit delta' [Rubrivivax sp. A210]CAD5366194.1 DNA polymerase III subunit delta [Rubrivivax sp. A210]
MVVDAGAGLMVGEDGELPLPWIADALAAALGTQRGHALLLHAAPGSGALPFALTLAQAWLCEVGGVAGGARRPCGRCGSCHLVQARVHPDLRVLLPETLRREHDWPLADDKPEGDEGKRKPSRQIRVDEVRGLIDWVYKTSARGHGKVALLHPADVLNLQSANALLKTLEEPPAGTRVLLTTADPAQILPTVLSRCQRLRLADPPREQAAAWLAHQGVAAPEVLLAACSGRALDALALARAGVDARAWAAVPPAVARGQGGVFAGWPVPRVVDTLHKLCHDAMARACGAPTTFFAADAVPAQAALPALSAWSRELDRIARHDEHPWQEALLVDALVQGAAQALAACARRTPQAGSAASPAVRRLDTLPR